MIEFFNYTNQDDWIVILINIFSLIMVIRFFSTIKEIIEDDTEIDLFNISKIIISSIIILFSIFILSYNVYDDSYKQRRSEPGTSLLDIQKKTK